VVVQGNYAYVISQSNNRLCIYDISNPDNIVAKGFSVQNMNQPWGVQVQGNYAYVTSSWNNRLFIFDVSNPDNIVARGTIGQNLDVPRGVFVQGNYAYVTSFLNNQICIFDVSNPDNIVARGTIGQNLSAPQSVFVQGNYAYVTSWSNNRLCIYDVSNPDNIVAKGFSSQNLNQPWSVQVQGNYAYVTSLGNNLLCIYDISNPDAIRFAGSTNVNLVSPQSLFVKNNYAYVGSFATNRLCSYQLYNTYRSLVSSPAGDLALEATAWITDDNGAYRPAGNVGIGTVSPTQKLDVIGTTRTTNFQMTAGAANGFILRSDASGNASWVASTSLSVTETDPKVGTLTGNRIPKWNGTTLADGLILDNGTNVGIGTNNPQAKLHLVNAALSGGLYSPLLARLVVENNGQNYIQMMNNNASQAGIFSGTELSQWRSGIMFMPDSSLWLSAGGGAARLVVDNSGFIGVNQQNPLTYMDVNGSIAGAITTGTGSKTLTAADFTHIILSTASAVTITLPAANTCRRRIYYLVNQDNGTQTVSSFLNLTGVATTTINAVTSLMLQSDGTNWYQIR
jgi:hypothetical protein